MPGCPILIFRHWNLFLCFPLLVCPCEEDKTNKKHLKIMERRNPSFTGDRLTSISYVPLNEAFQHRDAEPSCTSRKHCRIAPYRSLILNVPVFSHLLKFVCRIFTLWDVKCTFFCFYSAQQSPHHLRSHCSSLQTFLLCCLEKGENRDATCFVMISCNKVVIK